MLSRAKIQCDSSKDSGDIKPKYTDFLAKSRPFICKNVGEDPLKSRFELKGMNE